MEPVAQPAHFGSMPSSKLNFIEFMKNYKNEAELGKGGEAVAHLWERTKSSKEPIANHAAAKRVAGGAPFVVVKTIRKSRLRVPREVLWLDLLERNLNVSGENGHKHIIRMLGYCELDIGSNQLRMLLEYGDQGDLCKIAKRFDQDMKPMEELMMWEVTTSLLSALSFLHEGTINKKEQNNWKPIIHRDIKPENIFACTGLNGCSIYKLADFGLCQYHDADNKDPIGTPHWQPPELPYITTPAADIWSVGAVLHWLVHREPPTDPHAVKTNLLPHQHSRQLILQYPRKVVPIDLSPHDRWSLWKQCAGFGIGTKKWARRYSHTLNEYMMSMLQMEPEKRPRAVTLDLEMGHRLWTALRYMEDDDIEMDVAMECRLFDEVDKGAEKFPNQVERPRNG